MTGQCCTGVTRRLSTAAASIVPAAVLVMLPKCPLCLAAWLTVATGVGVSAAGAEWVRASVLVFWIAAVALTAASILSGRAGRPRVRRS